MNYQAAVLFAFIRDLMLPALQKRPTSPYVWLDTKTTLFKQEKNWNLLFHIIDLI